MVLIELEQGSADDVAALDGFELLRRQKSTVLGLDVFSAADSTGLWDCPRNGARPDAARFPSASLGTGLDLRQNGRILPVRPTTPPDGCPRQGFDHPRPGDKSSRKRPGRGDRKSPTRRLVLDSPTPSEGGVRLAYCPTPGISICFTTDYCPGRRKSFADLEKWL